MDYWKLFEREILKLNQHKLQKSFHSNQRQHSYGHWHQRFDFEFTRKK